MRKMVLLFVLLLFADGAQAQSRPLTLNMNCAQAAALVASRGAVVMNTGRHTFDRYVAHGGYCTLGEFPDEAWVPTTDSAQCFVGYTCEHKLPMFLD